jgi:putative ABC transport system permease protein
VRKVRLLVLRRVIRAPLRSAMTVVTIAAGVALAVSITVVVTSVDRSLAGFGQALAGPADLQIRGATLRGGLPMGAVDRAEEVPGVEAVVPVVQAAARVQQAPGAEAEPVLILGIDCRAEALVGPIGCHEGALDAPGGVVAVGPGIAGVLGPGAVLRTDLGRTALGDAPVVDGLGTLADGRVVVMELAAAQSHLTRPERADVAMVFVAPGEDPLEVRDRLSAALGSHLPVVEATAAPAGSDAVLGAALPIFSMLGIFALGVGGVLVSNTAAMSLAARRRELAVLGALGGPRRTVGGTTVAEMGLLGAAGGLLGSLGGAVVAGPIVSSLSRFTQQAAGIPLHTHVSGGAAVTGVVLGTVLGAGASLLPVRRALAADVAAELSGRDASETARRPRLGLRVVLWTALAATGAVLLALAQRGGGLDPWQAEVVVPGFLLVTIGLLFAAAAAAPLLVGVAGRWTAGTGSAPLRLAVAAAHRDHRRTGVIAVAVGAAIATGFVTESSSGSARASIESSFARSGAVVDVATLPPDESIGPGVPDGLLMALAAVPGVGEVTAGRFVVAGDGEDQVLVRAIEGDALIQEVIDGAARADHLEEGSVLIGVGLARRQGVRAGDEVRLVTPGGPVELPVQGVWEEGSNVGVNVTMSTGLLTRLYGPQPPSFVGFRPAPGVDEADLAASLHEAGLDPELRTRGSAEVADDIARQVDDQFASFRVMQRALLAVLFVAVLSSLLLAGVHRRRELGLLGAVGAAPRDLGRLLVVEGGVVAVVAVAIAAVMGPAMQWAMQQLAPFIIGFRNPLTFDWQALAAVSAVAVVVAVGGAVVPARRASRVEVLDALRWE